MLRTQFQNEVPRACRCTHFYMECDITLIVYVGMLRAQWQESLLLAEALPRENGAVSDLEGGVQLPHSDGQNPFEPFGFSFCPNWRESGAQLTEKQAVLLMHDIYEKCEEQNHVTH